MRPEFARRMSSVHRSFIREILKVTEDPSIISFAGGLPKPDLFPVGDLARATAEVFARAGAEALQYSTTEGYRPLREWISRRYLAKGLRVHPDEILITAGSQQALDLIAKIFLDPGDTVLVERPGYLGAIQSFSFQEVRFVSVPLDDQGPDPDALKNLLDRERPKLFYAVPNFQNPSGTTYSEARRQAVAEVMAGRPTLLVEDDPYGELRFQGRPQKNLVRGHMEDGGLLLGSFSKIAAPGFRLGWVAARPEIMEKLVVAKQAADLHTSSFAQRVLCQWVETCDIDAHITGICEAYGRQCRAMVQAMAETFPSGVTFNRPEGGMFLWARLPEACSAMDLFERAVARKVAFVPGAPFYVDGGGKNTLRLNFSNSDEERIRTGVRRLGECLRDFLS